MYIRKTVIGDMYLSSSVIFIYLTFLYFGFGQGFGWIFLLIGLALAVFGAYAKNVLKRKEKIIKTKRRK